MAELIAASSALGVVSSLISFGDVAWKVVSRLKEYNTQFEDAPKVLRKISNQLPLLHENISKWKEETEAGAVIIDDGTALKAAIIGCNEAIASLGVLLEKVLPKETESKLTRAMKALKSVRYESEMSKIWADIESYRGTLIFHFTHRAPEILRETLHGDNQSLASTAAYYRIPNRLVNHYVDRQQDGVLMTERIDQHFTQLSEGNSRSRVVVLLGMGGSGKSQIALRYCERAKKKGFFRTIFWVDASSAITVAKDFAEISESLTGSQPSYSSTMAEMATGMPGSGPKLPTSVEQMIESVKVNIQDLETPWMFVFDNYDQPDEFQFHGRFKSIRDYWPASANGAILITSRHESCERLGKTFHVGRMLNEEACDLLLNHIEETDQKSQIEAAMGVVDLLGCLALAVDQAGAYIRSQRLKISIYPDHFRSRKEHVLKRIPSGSEWEYRRTFDGTGKDTALSVFTTWELSLHCLSGSELEIERKKHFLTVAAFFNIFNIPEGLFREHFIRSTEKPRWMALFCSKDRWDTYKFGDLIVELKSLSILESLERSDEGSRFTFHPLVGEWIRIRLLPELQDFYATEAVLILHHSLPKNYREFNEGKELAHLQALIPHVTQCLQNFNEFQLPEHPLGIGDLEEPGISFVDFLTSWALYVEAEKILLDIVSWKDRREMPWTRYFLEIGMRLIGIYREKGDIKSIRTWTTLLYPQSQELLGNEDELNFSYQNLWGLMHVDMHDLEEAEKVFKANDEKCRAVWGSDSVEAARSRANLAIVYEHLGETSAAISYASDALHIYRDKRGSDDLSTLRLQKYLIGLIKEEKPEEALALALDCVSQTENRLGISHPKTVQSYFMLSKVYFRLGRFSDNMTLLNMIQKVFEKFRVTRGEETAELFGFLGFSYANDDDDDTAEKMFAQSVAIYREMDDLHTINSLTCINRIAHICTRRGEYAKAEGLYKEAISSYERFGMQQSRIDEKLYLGYYRILYMQNFFEDASREAEIRAVAELAMRGSWATSSRLAYQRHVKVVQFAYSFLNEPVLADNASNALLELGVWRFGIEGRPSERDEAEASYELAVQALLPLDESEVGELVE